MVVSRAFSPGHVTGFFSIHPHEDPLLHGSIGAGFSIDWGVTSVVERSDKARIFLNGARLEPAPVSTGVLEAFHRAGFPGEWTVRHETSLPIGCGFGTSGAAALSLAWALNHAEGDPLSSDEAGALAHLAELGAGTGLGTVLAESVGGFEVRTRAGAPGMGRALQLPVSRDLRAAFVVFGPLATPQVLADPSLKAAISREGESLLHVLTDDPRPEVFLDLSFRFGRGTGLVSAPLAELQERFRAEGVTAPMLMFGNGLFTLVDVSILKEVLTVFERAAPLARVFGAALDPQGGRLVRD